MDLCSNRIFAAGRRDCLRTLSCGFGLLAFAGIANHAAASARIRLDDDEGNPLAPKSTHMPPRAKRVIFLCMSGGPSHVDTFDYKPDLTRNNGKGLGGTRAGAQLLASPFKFRQSGKSGLWISDLFPEVAKHADSLCLLRGMSTAVPAHAQASVLMHTGSFQFVRPSFGAWTLYGLGTENQNLPGFITLNPPAGNGGAQNYGAGFLPAVYQGTRVGMERSARREGGDGGMPNLRNPVLTAEAQRDQLDLVQRLNKERLKRDRSDDQIEGVIESYELAFRMQAEMPELMDISDEKPKTLEMYGIGGQGDGFARQCLLARRFAEKGVRFIEVNHGGWDTHRNLKADLERQSSQIDKPIAALLADLKQRKLLDDTLVVWGGEFGRTPYAQGPDGRDHNHKGFTMWVAGGGTKGGTSYGATDENGIEAVDGKMDIHDWHATLLALMGMDHERLTYRWAGRDFRLTDVKGNVHRGIFA
ncbi:MAG: DUF1501 domain-containing protein [Planctomycetes bacterium]|nr:DUF1501 domain-containing protein [Planctomycetota bacterium]